VAYSGLINQFSLAKKIIRIVHHPTSRLIEEIIRDSSQEVSQISANVCMHVQVLI
jgi:hypothetical protein